MKTSRILLTALLAGLLLPGALRAQTPGAIESSDWTRIWTNFKPGDQDYPTTNVTVSGVIDKATTWTRMNTYLLQGTVYVAPGAVLTIEPGTIIRGDESTVGALVVTRGGKIMAEGTVTEPIIFTSNKAAGARNPGDWGGVVLLGNASINKIGGMAQVVGNFRPEYGIYGGSNDLDNSGVLKYVRIEFPGRKIDGENELNGLSLGGVGSKTVLDYVQVSYSNDDSFEWYGGSVGAEHLISFRGKDDDFDFTMGYEGQLTYGLAIRHPLISDFSGSRCVEIDSYKEVSGIDPTRRYRTSVTLDHFTFVNTAKNPAQIMLSREAINVGNDALISVSNTVVSGFSVGVELKADKPLEEVVSGKAKFFGCLFNCPYENTIRAKSETEKIIKYFYNSNFRNLNLNETTASELFRDPFHSTYPNYTLKPQSLLTSE